MDLLDYADCQLYYEEPLPPEAEALLARAAHEYGGPGAEAALLRAHLLAPESLTVVVGLYRFYFYQHRLDDALHVAGRAMQLSGRRLGQSPDWQHIDDGWLGRAAASSFGLLRFYLLALKAASVAELRLGRVDEARARLQKLVSVDTRDQLGGAALLRIVDDFESEANPAPPHVKPTLTPA